MSAPGGRAHDPDSAPYWEALADGRLVVQRCRRCGARQLYFRAVCRVCWARDLEVVECAGTGTVHSFTVQHQPGPRLADQAPFVIAIVELAEGPRLVTRMTDDPRDVSIGDAVRVVFRDDGDRTLPFFEKVERGRRGEVDP